MRCEALQDSMKLAFTSFKDQCCTNTAHLRMILRLVSLKLCLYEVFSFSFNNFFFADGTPLFPPRNVWHFALQRNQSTFTTNATTDTVKRSTWIRRTSSVIWIYVPLYYASLNLFSIHPKFFERSWEGKTCINVTYYESSQGIGIICDINNNNINHSKFTLRHIYMYGPFELILKIKSKKIGEGGDRFITGITMKTVPWKLF